jgi:hypothetical protein
MNIETQTIEGEMQTQFKMPVVRAALPVARSRSPFQSIFFSQKKIA